MDTSNANSTALTPSDLCHPAAVERSTDLWEALDADVMDTVGGQNFCGSEEGVCAEVWVRKAEGNGQVHMKGGWGVQQAQSWIRKAESRVVGLRIVRGGVKVTWVINWDWMRTWGRL